jgi:hypothetical protein
MKYRAFSRHDPGQNPVKVYSFEGHDCKVEYVILTFHQGDSVRRAEVACKLLTNGGAHAVLR